MMKIIEAMKEGRMRYIPIAVFVLLAFFLWRGLSTDKKLPSAQIGKPIPQFALPRLDNNGTFTPKDMKGHISILNAWGSWCSTCNLEVPFLKELGGAGLSLYGLNYKDTVDDANQWLKDWGNPYLMIGRDESGDVAIDLGVYGAPETFLIDSNGIIQYRHIGGLDKEVWMKEFLPRIKQLRKGQ